MTVAEMKEILAAYRDEMELYIVAEDYMGKRRLLLAVNDSSKQTDKVFLSGRLSKGILPREMNQRLSLN